MLSIRESEATPFLNEIHDSRYVVCMLLVLLGQIETCRKGRTRSAAGQLLVLILLSIAYDVIINNEGTLLLVVLMHYAAHMCAYACRQKVAPLWRCFFFLRCVASRCAHMHKCSKNLMGLFETPLSMSYYTIYVILYYL